jgi:GntR family transcriptional regulator, galactonate operon transcriptional repressor
MTRLHRDHMRALVDDIVRGRIAEGDWLPKEVDLVQTFGVSRGVVRETIRALEERGVVAVRHGRGARVRPIAEWDLLDREILGALVESDDAAQVIAEALECRRVLEAAAAADAAAQIRPDGARRLTESFTALKAAARDGAGLAQALSDHRRSLAGLSRNRPRARMLAPLDAIDSAIVPGLSRAARARLVERHERILAAVCEGDAGAARAAIEEDVDATAALLGARGRPPGR